MISDLTSLEVWAGLMSRWLHHSRMKQALGSSVGWMKWAPGPRAVYDKHLYAAVIKDQCQAPPLPLQTESQPHHTIPRRSEQATASKPGAGQSTQGRTAFQSRQNMHMNISKTRSA